VSIKMSLNISKEVSKHLFLSNLINSNDDKITDIVESLKVIVKNKANNKLAYLNTLEYKLKRIRLEKIVKEIEEGKLKKTKK